MSINLFLSKSNTFLCNINFFCWLKHFLVQHQLLFVTKDDFLCNTKLFFFFQQKIVFRATKSFFWTFLRMLYALLSRSNKYIIMCEKNKVMFLYDTKKNNFFWCWSSSWLPSKQINVYSIFLCLPNYWIGKLFP